MLSPIDPTETPILLPLPRAVAVSGMSRSVLYRAAATGRLRMLKAGRATLVDFASLRALLDSLPAFEPKLAA